MIFSEEDLRSIHRAHQEAQRKYEQLLIGYLSRAFQSPRAQEFAIHGFVRRLKTLLRCIDSVFQTLPPERMELPESEELSDATINIQAFVTNVFGAMDNLAWVLVYERNLRKADRSALPRKSVGLRPGFNHILRALSPEFRQYIESLGEWVRLLESFRHALAHRIPLYIPPYFVPEGQRAAHQDLEERMTEALGNADLQEHARLEAEQDALKSYEAYITHSLELEEQANLVAFHPQMLADFCTVHELGRRMLAELDRDHRN